MPACPSDPAWSHAAEGPLETADFQANANDGGRRVGFLWRDWLVMAGLSMQVIGYMVVLSALRHEESPVFYVLSRRIC